MWDRQLDPVRFWRSEITNHKTWLLFVFMRTSSFAAFLVLVLFFAPALLAQEKPKFTRTEDVVYGRKFGLALTLDVFQPETPNGTGVFMIESAGYVSDHAHIRFFSFIYRPLLERGYTVFVVGVGAQPRFIVSEMEEDMHRAVRFVRHNASRWGVDPARFGVVGGSSGGQLALTLATQGRPGDPAAKDEVDREGSVVQAVACLFPVTDYLNWSRPDENWMDYEANREYAPAFGPRANDPETRQALGREISPIYFVTGSMAPALIIHGDADKVVPLYQSQAFERKCQEVGAPMKLIVKPGAGHGREFGDMSKELAMFPDWFDEHLRGIAVAK